MPSDDIAQIACVEMEIESAGLDASAVEEILDHSIHPLHLVHDAIGDARIWVLTLEQRDAQPQRVERSAQIVRHASNERELLLVLTSERFRHVVERHGDLPELLRPLFGRHGATIAGTEPTE